MIALEVMVLMMRISMKMMYKKMMILAAGAITVFAPTDIFDHHE